MRIAFFETSSDDEEFFRSVLPGHEIHFFTEELSEKTASLAENHDAISVFIHSDVNRATLDRLPRLRAVATRSTGFDHIDTDACRERGISVMNVPSYGENTVAEHAFALILALSRNVHKSYARGKRGDYAIEGLMGFDLAGKTLGVVGTGRIGLHVIRIAKGFGMHVIAHDPHTDPFLAEVLHFRYAPLEETLSESDIVTIHVPLNDATAHLINRGNIDRFKKGSLLVNTSRGGVVENEAIIYGLDHDILAGAGLDVLEGEEHIREEAQCLNGGCGNDAARRTKENRDLLSRDNVVFTPHIGFYSREAIRRILDTTARNLRSFSEGTPSNAVA
jgi:D-lactate dehydrogenase